MSFLSLGHMTIGVIVIHTHEKYACRSQQQEKVSVLYVEQDDEVKKKTGRTFSLKEKEVVHFGNKSKF